MKTIAMLFAVAGGLWISVTGGQDPQKPPAPPAVEAPPAEAVKAESKEIVGMPPRDPLEGLYELRSRTENGVPDLQRSRGYVAITRGHMLICLAGAGEDPEYPLLRAGVRSWAKTKEGVETVIKLGFFTDEYGEVHVEAPGTRNVRRIDLIRGKLRIWQDDQSFLDFERIE